MSKESKAKRKSLRQAVEERRAENNRARLDVIAKVNDRPVFVCKKCEQGSFHRPKGDRCPVCQTPVLILPAGQLPPPPPESTP